METAKDFVDRFLNMDLDKDLNWEEMTVMAVKIYLNSKIDLAILLVDNDTSLSGCNDSVKNKLISLKEII